MEKHLTIILKEMCRRVKAPFKHVNSNPDWFMGYEWTPEQEEKYKEWLINYLYNTVEARNELLNYPIKNKESIRRGVNEFIFNYGWKLKGMSKE